MTRQGRLLLVLAAVGLVGGGCGGRTATLAEFTGAAGTGAIGGAGTGAIGGDGTGGSGDCCVPSKSKSCQNTSIAMCVCASDKYCCASSWDSACVNEVGSLGCGSCGVGGTGGGGTGGIGGGGTGGIGGGGTGGIGGGGTGGVGGDCCTQQQTPGCNDPNLTQCVCSQDPYCCKQRWDQVCVNEITTLNCGPACTTGGGGGVAGTGGTGGVAGGGGVSGGGGTGGVGQCVAQAKSACEACACQSCFSQLGSCIGDFGCPEILDCVRKTGCTGMGCYQPGTCKSVVDNFGGLAGPSVKKARQLYECTQQSGCPCP